VTLLSDDWNRFDDRWAMICTRCKNEYALYSYDVNRKGMSETHRTWAPKALANELKGLHQTIDDEQRRITTRVQTNYGQKWKQHFDGKTKKAIWSELTGAGRIYPSLATFYSHIRYLGLEKVLSRYLDHRELDTIRRVLAIKDSALNTAASRIQDLKRQAEKLHRQIVRA
jgi:hypothetical protein